MDELAALPYLDMVVRETLRLHAPVASTMRVATRDDIIPLNKPFIGRDGVEYHSIAYVVAALANVARGWLTTSISQSFRRLPYNHSNSDLASFEGDLGRRCVRV